VTLGRERRRPCALPASIKVHRLPATRSVFVDVVAAFLYALPTVTTVDAFVIDGEKSLLPA
jgi:hypothetical protein